MLSMKKEYKSKSILAKLLASENILVETKNTTTAYFDLKSRTIIIPSWDNISEELYDLFLGHEVGHALFTPPKGWHTSIEEQGTAFKSYLNVVEDVRIERLIKLKYPGLKQSFYRGYNELNAKNFFGAHTSLTFDKLLIDRINLHYKVGSIMDINFSDEETTFIKKIDNLQTWEDVVEIAKLIFEHDKKNQKLYKSNLDDLDYTDYDDNADDDDFEYNNEKTIKDYTLDPQSETDTVFRQKIHSLNDNNTANHYNLYVPEPYIDNIVVPYKKLYSHINKFTSDAELSEKKKQLYNDFLLKNKTHISYLVKEFELRRNAKQFARAKISKIGELDTKKAFAYKIKDDIFKQVTIVPNGKSHGLIMYIDMSGSMQGCIRSTIEQTIILAMFCRNLSIPFRIYGFTDNYTSENTFFGKENMQEAQTVAKFSKNPGEINANFTRNFHLKEYLSNEMTMREFVDSVKNWLLLSTYYGSSSNYICQTETLSNTPLQETIFSAISMVPTFKATYKLDIVNTIFLTDGEASEHNTYLDESLQSKPVSVWSNVVYHIKHKKTGKEFKYKRHVDKGKLTNVYMQMLKEITNTKVVGFFILSDHVSIKRGIVEAAKVNGTWVDELDLAVKIAKKEKVYNLHSIGYDANFIVPSLDIIDNELKIESEQTKTTIRNAFLKLRKSKNSSRVLLNKFIEKIA